MRTFALSALLVAAGCTQAPPTAAQITSNDGANVLFDTVAGPPSLHVFHFQNSGGTRTLPLLVSLHGDTQAFAITSDECNGATLDPNGWCGVHITLADELSGDYIGRLSVTDGTSSVAIDLAGRVSPANVHVATMETKVVEGNHGQATILVRNDGGARSGVLSLDLAGATLLGDRCSGQSLVGGGSCSFDIDYAAPFGTTGKATLHGSVGVDPGGKQPFDVVFDATSAPMLTITSGDLGTKDPECTYYRDITVTNPGKTELGPLSVTLGATTGSPSPGAAAFLFENVADDHCSGRPLAANASCQLHVRVPYNLPVPGVYSAIVSVTSPNAHGAASQLSITTALGHANVNFSKSGTGDGKVSMFGVDYCPLSNLTCNAFPTMCDDESEIATATAAAGSKFTKWNSGPCAGSSNPSCTVKGANHTNIAIEAVFDKQ